MSKIPKQKKKGKDDKPPPVTAEINRLIGRQLRSWREAYGQDLQTVAPHVYLSRQMLGAIEDGEKRATRDTIIRLADHYGRSSAERHWLLRIAGKDESFDFDSDPEALENLKKNPPPAQIREDLLEIVRQKEPDYEPVVTIVPRKRSDLLQDTYPIEQISWAFNAMLLSPHLHDDLRAEIKMLAPSIFVQAAFVEVFCRKTATRLLAPLERSRMLELLFGTTTQQVSKAVELTWEELHHFAHFLGTGIDIGNRGADTSEHKGLGLLLRLNNSKLDLWQPKGDVEPFAFHVPREVRDDYEYEDDDDRPWLWSTEPPAPSAPENAARQDVQNLGSLPPPTAKKKRPAVSAETTDLE